MILFSDRRNAELDFINWCKETGAQNCPMNVIAWLQSTSRGKSLLIYLYADLIESIATIPIIEEEENGREEESRL